MAAVVFLAATLTACSDIDRSQTTENDTGSTLETSLLVVTAEPQDLSEIASAGAGGAIEAVADGIIGIDLKGQIFYAAPGSDPVAVASGIETNAASYYAEDEVAEEQAVPLFADRFRVLDIAIRPHDGASQIIVAHNHFDVVRRCVSLRVSMLVVSDVSNIFATPPDAADWKVIFETEPCLPLRFDAPGTGPVFQNGHVSGGRLAIADNGALLISVGDFSNNGVDAPIQLAQADDTPYGKIVRLAEDGAGYDIISKGHRNPQGLVFDGNGVLYEVEHGPRGGDELNVIVRGKNYGWPVVTMGTNYGTRSWPPNPAQGRHELFERPVFAWTPSIAPSNLIRIHGFAPEWDGDFLIGTLRDQSLWRTRLVDGRVIVTERISVDARVRDIVQTEDGAIVLWTDDARLITLRPVAATG